MGISARHALFCAAMAANAATASSFAACPVSRATTIRGLAPYGARLPNHHTFVVGLGGRRGKSARPPSSGLSRAKCQQNPQDSASTVTAPHYLWFLGILPLISVGFPPLIEAASTAAVPEDRRALIILLLILKRVYIYLVAISCVDIAARRSFAAAEGLGQRIQKLNDEILGNLVPETEEEKKVTTAAYKALDEVDGGTQALLLPAVLAAILASSFFFLTIGSTPPPIADASPSASASVAELFSPLAKALPVLSSAGVCVLFTRSELAEALKAFKQQFAREASQEGTEVSGTADDTLPLAASAALVAACFVGPSAWVWPAQNVVNSCLAVTAARAVQLPTFKYVALALTLLIGYDVISVYGTGALVAPAAAAQQAASSVMETVARSKLQEGGLWQAGLLEVVVNGKVTDALGLGDVVFPSMLAGWALREDGKAARAQAEERGEVAGEMPKSGLYSKATMGGYAFGCFLCEFFNSGGGQPALLFLIPPMLLLALSVAGGKGDLGRFLKE